MSKILQANAIERLDFFRARGFKCEWCQYNRKYNNLDYLIPRDATDVHHALIRRDERFPELDVEENFAIVCHTCHMSGEVDTPEFRAWFWEKQCARYGREHMEKWLESLPFKSTPRIE